MSCRGPDGAPGSSLYLLALSSICLRLRVWWGQGVKVKGTRAPYEDT